MDWGRVEIRCHNLETLGFMGPDFILDGLVNVHFTNQIRLETALSELPLLILFLLIAKFRD